jgi:hypothetical protein
MLKKLLHVLGAGFLLISLFQYCKSDNKENKAGSTPIETTKEAAARAQDSSRLRIKKITPYDSIIAYNDTLKNRMISRPFPGHYMPLKVKFDTAAVESTIRNTKCKYLVAVLGIHTGNLTIDILGIDPNDATNRTISTNSSNYNTVKGYNQTLKARLANLSHVPFMLTYFTLAVRMDTADFAYIRSKTNCKYFLVYPGIESPRPQDGIREKRLTISILGSQKDSDSPHSLYNADSGTEGGQTWPDDYFTLTLARNTDIIWP